MGTTEQVSAPYIDWDGPRVVAGESYSEIGLAPGSPRHGGRVRAFASVREEEGLEESSSVVNNHVIGVRSRINRYSLINGTGDRRHEAHLDVYQTSPARKQRYRAELGGLVTVEGNEEGALEFYPDRVQIEPESPEDVADELEDLYRGFLETALGV